MITKKINSVFVFQSILPIGRERKVCRHLANNSEIRKPLISKGQYVFEVKKYGDHG